MCHDGTTGIGCPATERGSAQGIWWLLLKVKNKNKKIGSVEPGGEIGLKRLVWHSLGWGAQQKEQQGQSKYHQAFHRLAIRQNGGCYKKTKVTAPTPVNGGRSLHKTQMIFGFCCE